MKKRESNSKLAFSLLKKIGLFVLFLAIILHAYSFINHTSFSESLLLESEKMLKTEKFFTKQKTSKETISNKETAVDLVDKNSYVVLKVDTENINEENPDEYVIFYNEIDGVLKDANDPEKFLTKVDKNMKIYWRAEPQNENSNLTIDVLEIYRKPNGGAEILKNTFKDHEKKGVVVGKIKNKKVIGLEYYIVVFRINTEAPRTFYIDPKLQMNGGE